MSVIQINRLTKDFGPVRAVDELSFEIEDGTIVGFPSPNGSGKTTTHRDLRAGRRVLEPRGDLLRPHIHSRPGGSPMTRLIRSEFIKLRALRSTDAVGPGLLALVAFIVAAALADAGKAGMTTTPTQLCEPIIVAVGLVTALFLAVLGASATAGEYRHATRSASSPRPSAAASSLPSWPRSGCWASSRRR